MTRAAHAIRLRSLRLLQLTWYIKSHKQLAERCPTDYNACSIRVDWDTVGLVQVAAPPHHHEKFEREKALAARLPSYTRYFEAGKNRSNLEPTHHWQICSIYIYK